METKLERIAVIVCCESNFEERSAGNPHATFCGGWGAKSGSPFYLASAG